MTSTCAISDCNKPHWARGYCTTHYQRLRKYGDPLATPKTDPARIKRDRDAFFWANIDRSGGPDSCWPWLRTPTGMGYGQMRGYDGQIGAHRFAWELQRGPITDSLTVEHMCHTNDLSCPGGPVCRHRLCCNASHLELITFSENVERAEARNRVVHNTTPRRVSLRTCTVAGCTLPVTARDCCIKHYQRLRRHGDTSIVLR